MEEEKYCCNCKFMNTHAGEDPCCHCYNRSNWESRNKFKTGDIVISKNNYKESRSIYIYLRNKWVMRIPYFVTVGSSFIVSSTRYRIIDDMIDKLIGKSEAECEWLDELEYASPEVIEEHNATANMVFECESFGEWFSKLINEEPSDQMLKMAMNSVYGSKAAKKESLKELYKKYINEPIFTTPNMIKNVIFSDPATIIFWEDGTKTVVKTQDGEKYDKEKGFAMAVCKKVFGNERDYYHVFKRWMRKGKEVK